MSIYNNSSLLPNVLEGEIKQKDYREPEAVFVASIDVESSSVQLAEPNNTSSRSNAGTVKKLRVHLACNICSSLFETSAELKKHMLRHKYKCRLCDESFSTAHIRDNHLIHIHGEPKYYCRICRFVAWTKADIKEHMIAKHLDPFCSTCKLCNMQFQTRFRIERHYLRCHTTLTVGCTICKRNYKSYATLNSHIKLEHLKSGYECKICTRQLTSVAFLEMHMRIHEGKQRDSLQAEICTTCGEMFYNRRNLTEHVASAHGKLYPHVCPICKKAFAKRANQVQHILSVHMTNIYECDVCEVKFPRRENLITHRKRNHPEIVGLGTVPNIPIRGLVGEFVRNYIINQKNSHNGDNLLLVKSEPDEVPMIIGD